MNFYRATPSFHKTDTLIEVCSAESTLSISDTITTSLMHAVSQYSTAIHFNCEYTMRKTCEYKSPNFARAAKPH